MRYAKFLFVVIAAALVAMVPFSAVGKEKLTFDTPEVSNQNWTSGRRIRFSPESVQSSHRTWILLALPQERLYLQATFDLDLVVKRYQKSAAPPPAPVTDRKCLECHGGGGGTPDSGNPGSGGRDSGNPGVDSGNPGIGGANSGNPSETSSPGGDPPESQRPLEATTGVGTGDGQTVARSGTGGASVFIYEVEDLPAPESLWKIVETITLAPAPVWQVAVHGESNPCLYLKAKIFPDPNDVRDPEDPDVTKRPPMVPLLLRKVASKKPPKSQHNDNR